MAKLKEGISRLNSAKLVIKVRNVVTMMEGNEVYSTIQDQLPALTTASNALDDANQEAAFIGGKIIHEQKRIREWKLRKLVSDLTPQVQTLSGGDVEKILSAGFDVIRKPERKGVPGEPQGFEPVYTPYQTAVKFRWQGQDAVRFFQLEQLDENGKWSVAATTTRTTHTIKGLVSGKRYSFRIYAVGTAGASASSAVVEAMAA